MPPIPRLRYCVEEFFLWLCQPGRRCRGDFLPIGAQARDYFQRDPLGEEFPEDLNWRAIMRLGIKGL